MRSLCLISAVILLLVLSHSSLAIEPPKVVAAGEWSKAVTDADGYALRARLVLCERDVMVGGRADFPRQLQHEMITYLELQDAGERVGKSMRIFCDLGKSDLRPEYKGGLHCELLDQDNHKVAASAFPFGGGVPLSQWVTLPPDATLRLRCSPFAGSRADGFVISPGLEMHWTIAMNDPKEYTLAGTFTVEPGNDQLVNNQAEHIWRGTIALSPVKISARAFAAATQPAAATTQAATTMPDAIAALVDRLSATHGLWVNGVSPILNLPADANDDDVLAKVFKMTTPPEGKITSYKILEKRQVEIPTVPGHEARPEDGYQAIHLETNVGPKIVLLQHTKTGGWWSRIYSAEESK
jgi:hypothetical protein